MPSINLDLNTEEKIIDILKVIGNVPNKERISTLYLAIDFILEHDPKLNPKDHKSLIQMH